jgi:bacterioferritin-associated ferredoxin
MIICVCFGISEEDMERVAKSGCDSFEEYLDVNNMGAKCGICLISAERIFDEIKKKMDDS